MWVKLANRRFGNKEQQKRKHSPRSGTNIEWRSPSERGPHQSTQNISESGSHRNCQIKNAHHPSPLIFRKHISHKNRRENDKTGFADSYQRMANKKASEVMCDGREQRGTAPNQSPRNNHGFSRETFCQRPHKGGRAHVEKKKYAGQHPERGVATMEFRLDQVLHREQN